MYTIDTLLTDLETITPAQLALRLKELAPHLEHDDWSGILYTVEDVAAAGQSNRALELMNVCEQQANLQQNEWLLQAIAYFQGGIYRLRGETEQAIASYQSAVDRGLTAGDEDGQAQAALALSGIARVRMAQGQISEAIDVTKRAIALAQESKQPTAEITDRWSLAGLYLTQERFDLAESLLWQTLEQARQMGDPLHIALTWSRLGSLQEDINNNETALKSYQNALTVLEEAEDDYEDFDLWLSVYQDALTGLAMVQQNLGKLEYATANYAEAARMAYDLYDRRKQAVAITWLGTAQLEADLPKQALRSFNAALRLAKITGYTWWMGTIYIYQASAWQALEHYREAEQAVRLAIQLHTTVAGEHSADEVACWVKLGDLALWQGRIDEAITHYQQAITTLKNLQVDVGMFMRLVYTKLGGAYWHAKDLSQAYNTLHQALSIYESKRQTVRAFLDRISFAPSRDELYAYLARTCLAMGKPEEAFKAIEESRARVFREQLAERHRNTELGEVLGWQQVGFLLGGELLDY